MMLSLMLMQEMLYLLVPLLSHWHLPARQCASVTAAWNFQVYWSGLWPPVRPVWIKEKAVVKLELCWTITMPVQPQDLTFVNKVNIMQFKFSQGSIAIVCRWSGQVNNCCVATYFSILCAKYYKNRSTFVKARAKWKRWMGNLYLIVSWSCHCKLLDLFVYYYAKRQHNTHDNTNKKIHKKHTTAILIYILNSTLINPIKHF